MKFQWVLLIVFTVTLLVQGDSKTYGHRKGENGFVALPSESEGTEGNFIGRVKEGKSPYTPQREVEKVLTNTKDGIMSNKIMSIFKSIGAGKSPFIKMVHLLNSPRVVSRSKHEHTSTNTKMSIREKRSEKVERQVDEDLQRESQASVFLRPVERRTVHYLREEPEFGHGETKSRPLESDVSLDRILRVKEGPMGKNELEVSDFSSGESKAYNKDYGQLYGSGTSSGVFGFEENEDSEEESVLSGEEQFASEQASGFKDKTSQGNRKPQSFDGQTTESDYPRRKRDAPEYESGYQANSERNTKKTKNKAFPVPVSGGIRWKGLSMAHVRSRDGVDVRKAKSRAKSEKGEGDDDGAVTTLSVVFILGGLIFVLLMGIILLFAMWPLRRYFQYLLSRTEKQDVESGEYDDGLSSIRVDRSYPSERPSDNVSFPQWPQYGQPAEHFYQTPGDARERCEQSSGFAQDTQAKEYPDQSQKTSREKIIADDKKRDHRNAERRKIIQRQTSERRESLVASLLVAKAIIDGYSKNKEFEEKASERRRKIKGTSSFSETTRGQGKRRKSFVEEVQDACSVITPNWDEEEKMEQSKDNRRRIKNRINKSRRSSLLDEIQVAKDVIVGNASKEVMLVIDPTIIPCATIESL